MNHHDDITPSTPGAARWGAATVAPTGRAGETTGLLPARRGALGAEDGDVTSRRQEGQATAEYALVLVGAATIAMLVITWAGSTSRIGGLFDAVLRSITSLVV